MSLLHINQFSSMVALKNHLEGFYNMYLVNLKEAPMARAEIVGVKYKNVVFGYNPKYTTCIHKSLFI